MTKDLVAGDSFDSAWTTFGSELTNQAKSQGYEVKTTPVTVASIDPDTAPGGRLTDAGRRGRRRGRPSRRALATARRGPRRLDCC